MSKRPSPPVKVDAPDLARRVIVGALVAEAALFVLNYVFNFYDVANDLSIRRIFNIAREQSIPTFFASLQAVLVGTTALGLRATARNTAEARSWLFVAVFWIYVGVDDNAEIHERLGSALARRTEDSALVEWWPGFSWQLFIAPILAAALFASCVIAWRFTGRGLMMLLVCLGAFAVAQGIDVLEGLDGKFDEWADSLDMEPYTVGHGFRSVEEMLEMIGTTAYWSVILSFFAVQLGGRSISFTRLERSAVSRPS